MNAVLSKVPGWAFAWGLGWSVFWLVVLIFLLILSANQDGISGEDFLSFILFLIGGGIGGLAGGLVAGLFTMLALRPNAPSISWKHMSPTIRIWAISGPVGMIVSGLITALMVAAGTITVESANPDCTGISFSDCLGRAFGAALGEAIGIIILILFVFLLFVIAAWFLTGMFAGWQVVRHIRRLEPGITNKQSRGVSLGWGCGSIVAAVVMMIVIGVVANAMGL